MAPQQLVGTLSAAVASWCDDATMFAVLSPLGEPLTVAQMTAVREKEVKSKMLMKAYRKECALEDENEQGVVSTVGTLVAFVPAKFLAFVASTINAVTRQRQQ